MDCRKNSHELRFILECATKLPSKDIVIINKSVISNLLAAFLVFLGLIIPSPYKAYFLNAGLFALSGGVTNLIAIHMLFERVPGFYGSGVVQLRFEEFKVGIRRLIMGQFFEKADLQSFFGELGDGSTKLQGEIAQGIDELDLDAAFESLLDVIMTSSFSGMLGMLGGRDALNSLKTPFIDKMKEFFAKEFASSTMQEKIERAVRSAIDEDAIRQKLESLIDQRLDEMTPHMVKLIVQEMIHKHLGWLVVWGCAFGGLLGLLVTLVSKI